MLNRAVVSGPVVAPAAGPPRTAADVAAHLRRPLDSDPAAPAWPCVVDTLHTHQAETLLRLGAERCGNTEDLGGTAQCGRLQRRRRRAAFLAAPPQRIVFP